MPYNSLSALRTLCKASDWTISNLQAQKLLYIAHMIHLSEGSSGGLVNESFQAWDYGPVLPSVYHSAKAFGDKPIKDIYMSHPLIPAATRAQEILQEAAKFNAGKRPAQLVAITHWDKGAWAKHYVPGARQQIIPNEDIIEEARERARSKTSDKAVA